MENKWVEHYLKMVKGELPHRKYYIVEDRKENQKGEGGVKLVTPTQAVVEQAKLTMKCNLEEMKPIKERKKRKRNQSGGRRSTVKTKKLKKKSTKLRKKKNIKKKSKKSPYKK